MPSKISRWSLTYTNIAVFFAFAAMSIGYAVFGGLMEPFIWSAKQFFVVVFFFAALSFLHNRYDSYSRMPLIWHLFILSVFIKASFCAFVLLVFDFPNVSAVQVWFSELICYPDANLYHSIAASFAKNISNGVFSLPVYYAKTHGISDYGYPFFLGLVYYLLSPQPICALISNVILSSISVVLTYKISLMIFDCRKTSYLAAVILMLFPYINYYAVFPFKETLVILLLLAYFYFLICLMKHKGNDLINFMGSLIIIYSMLYFRITLYLLLSICFLIAIYFRYGKQENILVNFTRMAGIAVVLLLLFSLSYQESQHEVLFTIEKSYSQIEGQVHDVNRQREIKKKTTKKELLPLAAIASLVAPFPSFVSTGTRKLTNIQCGNVFVKNVLLFFSYLGILLAVKNRNRLALPLIMFYAGYMVILTVSGVILQHRFQLIGLPFLIIFMSWGIVNSSIRHIRLWAIYLHCLLVIILAWNYYKLYIRAMI